MDTENFDHRNILLDEIINKRRTNRKFKQEFPPEDNIRSIINAGLHAPFAAAAVSNENEYFRKFFVLKKDSKSLIKVGSLVFEEVVAMASNLEIAMKSDSEFRKQAIGFAKRLDMIEKMGKVPGIGSAPYFIIVAEKKGFPMIEQQSLAHCLQNMWLKATALGLGFQLVSATAQMDNNPEFCALLGINLGEWALNGCAIGYPNEEVPPSVRPQVDEVIRWIE